MHPDLIRSLAIAVVHSCTSAAGDFVNPARVTKRVEFAEETKRAFKLESEADFVAWYSTDGKTDKKRNLHHPIRFTQDELEGFFGGQKHKGLIVVTVAKNVWTDDELNEHLKRLRDYFVARGYKRVVVEQAYGFGRGFHLEYPNPKTAEQGGAEQPATAPESTQEGEKNPKPESEGRNMKLLLLPITLIVVSLNPLLAEQGSKFNEKAELVVVNTLGSDLVLALQGNDEDEFIKCWVTTQGMVDFMNKLPAEVPVPKGDQLVEFRKYFDQIRVTTKERFKLIQKDIEAKNIDKSKIKFERMEVKYEVDHGLRRITTASVIFSFGENEYSLWIDDALKIGENWKFSDKPDSEVKLIEK